MTSQESYGKTIKNEKTNTTKEEEKDLNFCDWEDEEDLEKIKKKNKNKVK